MRVLCIDDEHSILEGMRELLQQWNVSVFTASNAQEATALAAQDRFDVVLADYQLQGAPCGLDLLESLVLRAKPRAVAGALVTADKTEAVVVRARTLGFQVLHKPVRPAALRALLAALAARISAQEAAQESAAGESA